MPKNKDTSTESALHEYPDYDTYKQVQTEGNKAKLDRQYVKKSHIAILSRYLNKNYGAVNFGLCHGVRQGLEQAWFSHYLRRPGGFGSLAARFSGPRSNVIGTDISDTAIQFENTIQWDFHDKNPDWDGKADFVYTNSWDHSYDPAKAFSAWIDSLKPGGLVFLDHTRNHLPVATSALDPFGATFEGLVHAFEAAANGRGTTLKPIDCNAERKYRATVFVFQKNR